MIVAIGPAGVRRRRRQGEAIEIAELQTTIAHSKSLGRPHSGDVVSTVEG
jgi:hypothetical protein